MLNRLKKWWILRNKKEQLKTLRYYQMEAEYKAMQQVLKGYIADLAREQAFNIELRSRLIRYEEKELYSVEDIKTALQDIFLLNRAESLINRLRENRRKGRRQ